jgi:erythritol kinase
MAAASAVVVGLDIDACEIRASGFDLSGRELALVRRPVVLDEANGGSAEIDPARLWQTAVRTIRQLADRIPDLGRRTVAVGLSGALGGLCLIDEDGDPLSPAISPLDRRRRSRQVLRSAEPIRSRLLDARIGWTSERRPGLLDHAAHALTLKDWIFFCLTGEVVAEGIEAGLTFGTGHAVALTGAGLAAHVALPAPPALAPAVMPLGAAASAATGWWEGTPVSLAPPGPLAAAIALGAANLPEGSAVSILDHDGWHGGRERAATTSDGLAMPVDGGLLRLHPGAVGGDAVAWLGEQIDSLLADAGLIGQPGEELRRVIDAKAAAAAPGRVLFRSAETGPGGPGGWSLSGLDRHVAWPDLLRAAYEAIGTAASEALAGDRSGLDLILVAGDLAASQTFRQIFAASLGLPLRQLLREAPVATGAAMVAAAASGAIPDLTAATGRWVEPYLAPAQAADPALAEIYADRLRASVAA